MRTLAYGPKAAVRHQDLATGKCAFSLANVSISGGKSRHPKREIKRKGLWSVSGKTAYAGTAAHSHELPHE